MARDLDRPSSRTLQSITLALFALASVALSRPALAIDVCGPVCNDVGVDSSNPYIMTCDVTVASGCSLTIESGVELRFQTDTAIVVDGNLEVNGTSGWPVTFTSDSSTPAASDWRGVEFQGDATGDIHHAEITYAVNGVVVTDRAVVTLDNVTTDPSVIGDGIANTVSFHMKRVYDKMWPRCPATVIKLPKVN